MKPRSPVLLKLAEWYEESTAGKHGGGKMAFRPAFEELLGAAGCGEGEKRELAERDLRAAQSAGVISLVPVHRREPNTFAKVRLAPKRRSSPTRAFRRRLRNAKRGSAFFLRLGDGRCPSASLRRGEDSARPARLEHWAGAG